MPATAWTVDEPREDDRPRWRELFAGYARFYDAELDDDQVDRVWGWLHDDAHAVRGLVVRDGSGTPQGLAHFFTYPSTFHDRDACWLEDLFVDPAARGTGAGDALLGHLAQLARDNGWHRVRWITADDNHRARGRYDKVAQRTMWVVYDMPPAAR
jgi:GNAT superfamily N-acetyltransferase